MKKNQMLCAAMVVVSIFVFGAVQAEDYRNYPTLNISSDEGINGHEGTTIVLAKGTKSEDVIVSINPITKVIGLDKKAKVVYMDGIWNCQSKEAECVRLDRTIYDPKHKRVGEAEYKIASPAKLNVRFSNGKGEEQSFDLNF